MSRTTQVRHLPTRIARRLRAGVFVAVGLGLMVPLGWAQARPHMVPPPPKRAPASRPAPPAQSQAPAYRPAPAPAGGGPAAGTRPGGEPTAAGAPLVSPGHPKQMEMHLGSWMDAHRNLSLEQQHTALDAEPGFRDLNPGEQAKLHQQLTQLNRMSPEKQQQRLSYAETMERFSPQQRQQVNKALGQLGALREDRKNAVARAYHQLRDMPEAQRQAYMNSPQFHAQFSDQERATVGNLVDAAPLLRSFDAPGSPKD